MKKMSKGRDTAAKTSVKVSGKSARSAVPRVTEKRSPGMGGAKAGKKSGKY